MAQFFDLVLISTKSSFFLSTIRLIIMNLKILNTSTIIFAGLWHFSQQFPSSHAQIYFELHAAELCTELELFIKIQRWRIWKSDSACSLWAP